MTDTAGYSQIATYLRARFRTLDSGEDPAYAPQATMAASPSGLREEFLASGHVPDVVARFLHQMDLKLDMLLARQLADTLEHDFPHRMEIHGIGASQLEFTTDLPVVPGDWLEVVISLGQQGLFAASGIGSVSKGPRRENGSQAFVLSFTRLAEEEREKIIRYVFSEQRRHLREKRLD